MAQRLDGLKLSGELLDALQFVIPIVSRSTGYIVSTQPIPTLFGAVSEDAARESAAMQLPAFIRSVSGGSMPDMLIDGATTILLRRYALRSSPSGYIHVAVASIGACRNPLIFTRDVYSKLQRSGEMVLAMNGVGFQDSFSSMIGAAHRCIPLRPRLSALFTEMLASERDDLISLVPFPNATLGASGEQLINTIIPTYPSSKLNAAIDAADLDARAVKRNVHMITSFAAISGANAGSAASYYVSLDENARQDFDIESSGAPPALAFHSYRMDATRVNGLIRQPSGCISYIHLGLRTGSGASAAPAASAAIPADPPTIPAAAAPRDELMLFGGDAATQFTPPIGGPTRERPYITELAHVGPYLWSAAASKSWSRIYPPQCQQGLREARYAAFDEIPREAMPELPMRSYGFSVKTTSLDTIAIAQLTMAEWARARRSAEGVSDNGGISIAIPLLDAAATVLVACPMLYSDGSVLPAVGHRGPDAVAPIQPITLLASAAPYYGGVACFQLVDGKVRDVMPEILANPDPTQPGIMDEPSMEGACVTEMFISGLTMCPVGREISPIIPRGIELLTHAFGVSSPHHISTPDLIRALQTQSIRYYFRCASRIDVVDTLSTAAAIVAEMERRKIAHATRDGLSPLTLARWTDLISGRVTASLASAAESRVAPRPMSQ